ncbi:hypothetical protein NIES2130_35210 [Scytonema sp. HK-05]|nr:hypothetical protein NIES2130_35210 [Scytonema sp. HK-05]
MAVEKKDFRGQIPDDLNRIVRAVAALRDKQLSEILIEALEGWLERPENQEVVKQINWKPQYSKKKQEG